MSLQTDMVSTRDCIASVQNNPIQILAGTVWLVGLLTQMQVVCRGRHDTGAPMLSCFWLLLLPEATILPRP